MNRTNGLTEADVRTAIERIRQRDPDTALDAEHVYEALTWGEGPGVIGQSGLQDWLWYQVPTKYLTDEPGYQARLAEAAAVLFDELGLGAYAEICRSEVTSQVHEAFRASRSKGAKALSRAMSTSGIQPPDLDDFAWGDTMGIEESRAHAAISDALEQAIIEGDLVPGGRAWRTRQKDITRTTLDGSHPHQPGQSWRTAVTTERISAWVDMATRRSELLGRLRAAIAKHLLNPIDPPPDVAEHMAPLTWFLQTFGDQQSLTQAGYLNRAFAVRIFEEASWIQPLSEFDTTPPRSEIDVPILLELRTWLQQVGALRKQRNQLKRTQHGLAMSHDAGLAWTTFTRSISADIWTRFVFTTALLMMLDGDGTISIREMSEQIAAEATTLGWRTTIDGVSSMPSTYDVRRGFNDVWNMFSMWGFGEEQGTWRNRSFTLTSAGRTTALAILRTEASGPRQRLS